ncbi:hypothetical protein PanWU01x14_208260 [Parasponia andersonii]|uniref:Uncharacterized protein n=1 Tax=Parasponia andersonii TaxID=3476 RepID=A0A2P5BUW0_PARAD|nr:hypothetical protein PanWU01x14_208260 [Parasponia andersonii]
MKRKPLVATSVRSEMASNKVGRMTIFEGDGKVRRNTVWSLSYNEEYCMESYLPKENKGMNKIKDEYLDNWSKKAICLFECCNAERHKWSWKTSVRSLEMMGKLVENHLYSAFIQVVSC